MCEILPPTKMDQSLGYYSTTQDLRFKMITLEEEQSLFRDARAGNSSARDFLIRNHLLYVATYALRLARGTLPYNEVVSAGNAALMQAIDRFKVELGNRFTSYLKPFVKGAVSALWRRDQENNNPEGNPPAYEGEPQNLNPRTGSGQGEFYEMNVESEDHLNFLRAELEQCKTSALSEQELELLRLHYIDGLNFADIAKLRTPPVTRSWIQACHTTIVSKLRAELGKRGHTKFE